MTQTETTPTPAALETVTKYGRRGNVLSVCGAFGDLADDGLPCGGYWARVYSSDGEGHGSGLTRRDAVESAWEDLQS